MLKLFCFLCVVWTGSCVPRTQLGCAPIKQVEQSGRSSAASPFQIRAVQLDDNQVAVSIISADKSISGFELQSQSPFNANLQFGSFEIDANSKYSCPNMKSSVMNAFQEKYQNIAFTWTKPSGYYGSVKFIAAVFQTSFSIIEQTIELKKMELVPVPSAADDIDLSTCGVSKSCYTNCTSASCQRIVTWSDGGAYVNFEIEAELNDGDAWTALGLSYDQSMGNDSVTACLQISNGSLVVLQSWNTGHSNAPAPDPYVSLVPGKQSASTTGSKITCRFSRYKTGNGEKVYYPDGEYFLLLPTGPVVNNQITKHKTRPVITAKKQNLLAFNVKPQ